MADKIVFTYGDTSDFRSNWANDALVEKLHKNVNVSACDSRLESFMEKIVEATANNRNVKMAMEVCIHCGACLNACPTFLSSGDIRNSPVGRGDLIRNLNKSRKFSGKVFGKLVGSVSLDQEYFDTISTYYYQCLECRRCGEICPFGVDQADVTRTVRSALHDVGKISRYTATVIDNVERTGNNMALPPAALKSTIEFARDEIKEEKNIDLKIKIDEPADAMLVPPSADFFSNIETLKGYMLFLHVMGIDYTFTTEHAELANFGLFSDYKHMGIIADHLTEVAKKNGVKTVIAGECGHGWRAFKNHVIPKLEKQGIKGVHIFHLVEDSIRSGKLPLDPSVNDGKSYVYQDPCNYARGGDLINEPRYILSKVVSEYKNSPHSRERTWCCGGGGGLLSDELLPLRTEYAKLWYNDARSVGGTHVIRPCAICKAQMSHTLPSLNKTYSDSVTSSGLMDLVYTAIPGV